MFTSWAQLVERLSAAKGELVHLLSPMTVWALAMAAKAHFKVFDVEPHGWLGLDRCSEHQQHQRPRRQNRGDSILVLDSQCGIAIFAARKRPLEVTEQATPQPNR